MGGENQPERDREIERERKPHSNQAEWRGLSGDGSGAQRSSEYLPSQWSGTECNNKREKKVSALGMQNPAQRR